MIHVLADILPEPLIFSHLTKDTTFLARTVYGEILSLQKVVGTVRGNGGDTWKAQGESKKALKDCCQKGYLWFDSSLFPSLRQMAMKKRYSYARTILGPELFKKVEDARILCVVRFIVPTWRRCLIALLLFRAQVELDVRSWRTSYRSALVILQL